MTYQLLRDQLSGNVYGALRTNADGTMTSFVFEPENPDQQQYLAWLAEGNTPLPADEQASPAEQPET